MTILREIKLKWNLRKYAKAISSVKGIQTGLTTSITELDDQCSRIDDDREAAQRKFKSKLNKLDREQANLEAQKNDHQKVLDTITGLLNSLS